MKKILSVALCLICSFILCAQADTTQKIIAGRKNSLEQQHKPYVILISGDGFRYDYAEKYQAKTLLAVSEHGIRAESMIPSYPSLTFPNHYTIVTGLYPSHHGIVDNFFYDEKRQANYGIGITNAVRDGSWYGGTPLWVLAEQQHMLTACFYWVGSEADIKGTLPTYYYKFNDSIPIERRIQIVRDWLQLPPDRRPHLITFYLPQVDHEGHAYGPDAPQTAQAVRWLDSSIQKLTIAVKKTGLPVNFIFVSDHGMTKIDIDNPLKLPSAIDTSKFLIRGGSQLLQLYAKNKDDITDTYNKLKTQETGFTVYLKSNMFPHTHYSEKEDVQNRIGDILLVPNWPQAFNPPSRKANPGAHGYDPYQVKDMHATFYAWGPAFKTNLKVPSFENVNVYPVITKILGLKYTDKIDGTPALAEKILK